jgi:hypothetical protein
MTKVRIEFELTNKEKMKLKSAFGILILSVSIAMCHSSLNFLPNFVPCLPLLRAGHSHRRRRLEPRLNPGSDFTSDPLGEALAEALGRKQLTFPEDEDEDCEGEVGFRL